MSTWIKCPGAGLKPRPGSSACTRCAHVRELRADGKVRSHKAVGSVEDHGTQDAAVGNFRVAGWVTVPGGRRGQIVGIEHGIAFVRVGNEILSFSVC